MARVALGPARRRAGRSAVRRRAAPSTRGSSGSRRRRGSRAARRVARRPGDAVRVAGLDDVGRQAGEHARHRAAAQRQPVAAARRQRQRRQRGGPARGAGDERHRERVPPAGLPRQATRASSAGSGARRRRWGSRTSSCRRRAAGRSLPTLCRPGRVTPAPERALSRRARERLHARLRAATRSRAGWRPPAPPRATMGSSTLPIEEPRCACPQRPLFSCRRDRRRSSPGVASDSKHHAHHPAFARVRDTGIRIAASPDRHGTKAVTHATTTPTSIAGPARRRRRRARLHFASRRLRQATRARRHRRHAAGERSLAVSTRSHGGGDTPRDEAAEATARKQRQIQSAQDLKDQEKKGGSDHGKDKAVQAGARAQPEQLPAQHLRKPGSEADLDLAPRFLAPDYRGSGKLEGMAALITGGDSGIGRAVAVLYRARGRRRRDRLPRRARGRGRRRSAAWRRKGAAACSSRATSRTRSSADEGRRAARSRSSAGSTCSSTTPPSRSTRASLEDLTDERLDETFRTNIFGYFHMAQARRCRT